MRWEVLLRPVGSEPLGVYWRRRLVLLLVVLVVVLLLATRCGGGSGKPTAARRATPTSSATPAAPTPAATSGATSAAPAASGTPARCTGSDLATTAVLAAHTYAAGTPVVLNVSIRNTGTVPCLLDTQPSQVTVSIDSGGIHNWANTDCAPAAPQPTTLAAGATHGFAVSWDRVRSEPGCPSAAPQDAGAGTYTVSLRVGGKDVAFPPSAAVFTLS